MSRSGLAGHVLLPHVCLPDLSTDKHAYELDESGCRWCAVCGERAPLLSRLHADRRAEFVSSSRYKYRVLICRARVGPADDNEMHQLIRVHGRQSEVTKSLCRFNYFKI